MTEKRSSERYDSRRETMFERLVGVKILEGAAGRQERLERQQRLRLTPEGVGSSEWLNQAVSGMKEQT